MRTKSLDTYVKKGLFHESVVEDGSDIIFVLDYESKVLYHNRSVKETLGYASKALVGKKFIDFIHPSEFSSLQKKFNSCKSKPYCQGVEFRFLCKDGTYKFLEFNSINLKQKEGLKGLIMDCRDITQRKKDAEELLMAQKARELFLANISHEIRTPINGISGMATLLSNNPNSEDAKTYLNAIRSASENLKVIINDILDLSSIESGKLKFERIDFNIEDLVVSLISTFKVQAITKNVDLHYNISTKAKGVFVGDPVRLNQILINLVGNALKFTHRGTITLNVTVSRPGKNKSVLQFDVIDTGIGVPQEKLETIFESFSQADASVTRKYGGTGLGLTIVKQLVELQKGWIKVESKENVGSTFSFGMPYVHGDATSAANANKPKGKMKEIQDLSQFTILLVEDNDINRLYAGSLLKSSGCKVEMAENGMVAIAKLKSVPIDLVLMDIQMPVMDGFEATMAIRAGDKKLKDVPIIALTANATLKVIEKCLTIGMNDHLAKPFTPDELYSKLEKYLDTSSVDKLISADQSLLKTTFTTVDLSFLAKVSGNDHGFVMDVVASILKAAPILVQNIKEGLTENNQRKMAQSIHKLKPSLTMIGLAKTKELADYLEAELTASDMTDYLQQGIHKFCAEVTSAMEELSEVENSTIEQNPNLDK